MVSNTMNNNLKKSDDEENEALVYGHKLTSVGPGKVSGNNMAYEPSNIDLAMKLHYLKVVYFLDSKAVEGLTLRKIKECLFAWLNYYYESCGRFRRSESGRPYIKCNDCGMRFLEVSSSSTIEEWLNMDDSSSAAHKLLVPKDHVIGPELTFSPPLFLQATFFKCGGISLGLSWAHVLGDAFSMAHFMNSLAQFFSEKEPNHTPFRKNSPPNIQKPIKASASGPFSLKDVGPLGDYWIKPTACEMDTFTFQVTRTQLAQLQAKLSGQAQSTTQPFEALCAVMWQAIAKTRPRTKPNVVTVVKKDYANPIVDNMTLRNNQVVSIVKTDVSVGEAQLIDLATLIRDWAQDERAQIGEMVDRNIGGSDFIIYGSNLTFVDFGEAEFYGFEVKGLSPRFVSCYIEGIGEEGVVLVLPPSKNGNVKNVTLILPKSYMVELKNELNQEWPTLFEG